MCWMLMKFYKLRKKYEDVFICDSLFLIGV